jgi:hypothetical protein
MPRDSAGFETGPQAGVSEAQVRWLSYRLGCETDREACALTSAGDAPVDLVAVRRWKRNEEFAKLYREGLGNKREGFRALSGQLLPKALRVLTELLDSEHERTRVQALTLLFRTNGMLIDKAQVADPDALAALVAALRAPKVMQVVEALPLLGAGSEEALADE